LFCATTVRERERERERESERVNDSLKQKELTNHGDDITNHQTSFFCPFFFIGFCTSLLLLVMVKSLKSLPLASTSSKYFCENSGTAFVSGTVT
jgi:hypothetical protein